MSYPSLSGPPSSFERFSEVITPATSFASAEGVLANDGTKIPKSKISS